MRRIFLSLMLCVSITLTYAGSYDVNKVGTQLFEITNKEYPNTSLGFAEDKVKMNKHGENMWRMTRMEDDYFMLDFVIENQDWTRLLATRYMPARLSKGGIEGQNRDVQFKIIPSNDNNWCYIQHKTTGYFLYANEAGISLQSGRSDRTLWHLESKKIDLSAIKSPMILQGDDNTAFRDPAVVYHNGTFYMYYSIVKTEENENLYWYIGYSKSQDLVSWSEPVIITEKNQSKNFGSPGNVIRFGDEWVICMQSYVLEDYNRKDPLRFGGPKSRLWIMRSQDLENWSEPEMLWVKGEGIDPGSMIDAYLVEDKDEKGKWWCFYKHKRISHYSYTYDLKKWVYQGSVESGENACVWVENDTYYLMTSPEEGMNIQKSKDLKNWKSIVKHECLGQNDWANWAGQRVTAGYVLDMRSNPQIGKYLMFYHGQGPAPKTTEIINSGCDMGIAWGDDFLNWNWPGK